MCINLHVVFNKLHKSIDLTGTHMFVCFLEDINTNSGKPLNRGVFPHYDMDHFIVQVWSSMINIISYFVETEDRLCINWRGSALDFTAAPARLPGFH